MASAGRPRAWNVEELLEWFEDVARTGSAQLVSLVDPDAAVRTTVLRSFYEAVVEHPQYGGGWPHVLPAGALAAGRHDAAAAGVPRMVWLGVRATTEPIAEAVQLADQLQDVDERGTAPSDERVTFADFRPAVEWRDAHGAGESVAQAFAAFGASESTTTNVAAAVRVVHTQLTGEPLLSDGGALRLDGPSLRTRALMAAAWVEQLAGRLPVVLTIDAAHAAGPFLSELVLQLHERPIPVLIVLSGAPFGDGDETNHGLAGPLGALRSAAIPARALPSEDTAMVGALLAFVSPDGWFMRAHVAAVRDAVGATESSDAILEELCAAGWTLRVSDEVCSFVNASAWRSARGQAPGMTTPETLDELQRSVARMSECATGDGGLARVVGPGSADTVARAVVLARWGELERAAATTPRSAWASAVWSQRTAGDGGAPDVSNAVEVPPALAVASAIAHAPWDAARAVRALRSEVDRLGRSVAGPSEVHDVRTAAARALLVFGDLEGADDAMSGLLAWLPTGAAEQLDRLREWRSRPGLVARSVATIENLHAIAVLRALVPGSAALGHVLLGRLELLERFGRLGTAEDAPALAREATAAFGSGGSANRDELWRAKRWAAWVAVRHGDTPAALVDLQRLLDETVELAGAEHPTSLSTGAWLARCELEIGRVDDALHRLESIVAVRRRDGTPDDPDLVLAEHWLGVSLARANRHADAVAVLGAVVDARTKALAVDDEDLLASRQALGSALANIDRVEEGLALLDDVVARRLLLDLPDAPLVVAARHSRATCLVFAGRHDEALRELDELVAIRTDQLGDDDLLLLDARNDRALALLFLDRWADALFELDAVVAGRERKLGSGDLRVLVARHQRAACLRALGLSDEALSEIEAVLRWTQSWPGDDSFRAMLRRELAELTSGVITDQ